MPLVPAAASSQASPQTAAPTSPQKLSEAAEAWDRTKDSVNVAILESFIARYRGTFYAELASLRLAELKRQAEQKSPAGGAPNSSLACKEFCISKTDWRMLQNTYN